MWLWNRKKSKETIYPRHVACTLIYIHIFIQNVDVFVRVFKQILVYHEGPETNFLWIPSHQSRVPYGAMIVGHKADGTPLYVAKVYDRRWFAGNYDPHKDCAEYLLSDGTPKILCVPAWEIPIVKYGMFKITNLTEIASVFTFEGSCNM